MRRLEVSLRPGRAERSSPLPPVKFPPQPNANSRARGGPRWSAGVRGGPCQAPRLGTDLRGPPCAAVDRLFSARKTAVTRERGVASGRSRAPRNRLGGAEPVAPCPGRWAAPRPRGGPPKVRIRRKKWEKNSEKIQSVGSPLPPVKFPPGPNANSLQPGCMNRRAAQLETRLCFGTEKT